MFKPQQFGRYLLSDRIARGGMSEIFIAKSFGPMGFEKNLVIKRILPEFAGDREFVRMFVNEAKLVCTLEHANIVQVIELGEVDGQYYIAMEYVNGIDAHILWRTLARRRQRLPVGIALFVVAETLKGLDFAHRATGAHGELLGVVHRDVSPSNILISHRGDVKIGDFGIALVRHESKSHTGSLKGKFGYMTPEQIAGLSVDHRSDIFSAGIVLAELLLGRRLFLGESDFETMHRVLNVRLDVLDEHESALPAAVAWIVRRALQREVKDRYQTASAFHEDIVEYLYQERVRVSGETLAAFISEYVVPYLREKTLSDESSVPEPPPSQESGPLPLLFPGPEEDETTTGRRALEEVQHVVIVPQAMVGLAPVEMTGESIVCPPFSDEDVEGVEGPMPEPSAEPEPEIARLVSGQLMSAEQASASPHPNFQGRIGSRTVAKILFRFSVVSESGLLALTGKRVGTREAELLERIAWLQDTCGSPRDGSWTLQRTCQIYLEHGQPSLLMADRSEEMLAAYLLSIDQITVDQVEAALRSRPQLKPVAALVAANLLAPLHVSRHATSFVLWSVLEAFSWSEGNFAFYHGRSCPLEAFPSGHTALALIAKGVGLIPEQQLDDYFNRIASRGVVASRAPTVRIEAFNPDALLMDCYRAIITQRPVDEAVTVCSVLGDEWRAKQGLYLMLECDLAELV
jgi:serine/threonine protein kinase